MQNFPNLRPRLRVWLVAATAFLGGLAAAAELKVLTAGAFKPVIQAEAAAFERSTGHKLVIENDTAGALLKRIRGGDAFDLVVLSKSGAAELASEGRAASAPSDLAKVAIGVAVAQGAPLPDIRTVDAFRQALLSARAIAVIDPAAGGSSGIYLAQLFERLGIAQQLRGKLVLVPGGLTATRITSGEADMAVHQVSELTGVPGTVLAGALPAEIQNYTVYSGFVGARSANQAAAAEFLARLQTREARAGMAQRGLEAP